MPITSATATTSSATAAAEAAAARAAAEAAARARAAEAARQQAAEAARQLAAQTAKTQAAQAQRAAARTELAKARTEVQSAPARQRTSATEQLQTAQKEYDQADQAFQRNVEATQQALKTAQTSSKKAAEATESAQVAAQRAGLAPAFSDDFSQQAEGLANAKVSAKLFTQDTFESSASNLANTLTGGLLGSNQSTATNLKLLAGSVASAPVTRAQDRAALEADVNDGISELSEATDESPQAGAEKLEELMTANADNPAYQKLLATRARPEIQEMSKAVNSGDDRMSGDELKGTLRGLSLAAAAAGPNGGQQIVQAFAEDMVDDHLDIDDEDQFAGAARAVIEEGTTDEEKSKRAAFFQVLSQELETQDRNPEAQSEIDKAVEEGLNGRPSTFENIAHTVDPVFDAAGDGLGWAGDRLGDVAPHLPDFKGPVDLLNGIAGTNIPNPLSPHDLANLGDSALNTGGDLVANAPEAAIALESALEYRSAIDDLGEDDSWSITGSAKGAAFFGELGVEGEVSVSRSRDWVPVPKNEGPDGEPLPAGSIRRTANGTLEAKVARPYTLTMSGELSVGVMGTLGANADAAEAQAGAGLTGRAGLQAGAQVELSFKTAEEAKHAMDVIAATAASGGLGAAGFGNPIAEEVFDASASELPSLITQNIKAVEVKLGAYGEISGGAGALAGVNARLGAEADGVARVEFSDGKPTWLSTRLQGSATASGTAGLGPASAKGSANLTGSLELRTPLADGFQLSDLAGVTTPLALTNEDTRAHLSLSSEVEAGAAGSGAGVRGEFDLYGDPADLIQSGALQNVLQGNWNGAIDSLEAVEREAGLLTTARVIPFTKLGVELGFSAQSTGFGASGSFGVGTTNSHAPILDYAGNASSTRKALDRAVSQLQLDELVRRGRNVWAA